MCISARENFVGISGSDNYSFELFFSTVQVPEKMRINKTTGMLGALGIMCGYGGYVMRTAFRRVYHAYWLVVFKNRFAMCCALTLGHFSAYNRPSVSSFVL